MHAPHRRHLGSFPSSGNPGEGQGGGFAAEGPVQPQNTRPLTLTLSPSTTRLSSSKSGRGKNSPEARRPPRTLCRKLWRGEILLLAFIATLVIGNFFVSADRSVGRNMLGHDFTAFYAAGHFADLRQFDKLYDIQAVKDFEQATGRAAGLTLGNSYGPFWNPPFYAWVFAPLAKLPYGQALLTWTLINVACLLVAVVLLCRMLGSKHARHWLLVPFLILTSMPLLQALSHGQNTCTSLLLLTVMVTCWRSGRGWAAGLVGGLLFYKPQLAAVVTAVMVLDMGLAPLLGLAITGSALLAITVFTMPGALAVFLHKLPANLRFMQIEHPYVWERHATLKAFWRLLLQGRGAAEPLGIVTALYVIGGGILALMLLRKLRSGQRDRLIIATIVTMPLLMPFYFDYDLMLLAIPAVLFAAEQLRTPNKNADRWTVRLWITLYLWMLINPGLAASTHQSNRAASHHTRRTAPLRDTLNHHPLILSYPHPVIPPPAP